MRIFRAAHFFVLGLALACVLPGQALGQATVGDERRSLLEQKLRLVEVLVSSQATKSLLSGIPPSERLDQGSQALIKARQAINDDRLDEAGRILDATLRTSASVRSTALSRSLSEDAQRQRYQNLVEQVAIYRSAIDDIAARERDGKAARELLTQIDRQTAEARHLAVADQPEAAGKILAETYRVAISGLSRLRAGEEVVQMLSFGSPAEEFTYEAKRYESTQRLVDTLIQDQKDGGDRHSPIQENLEAARKQHDAAKLARSEGKYRDAIPLMERAVEHLNRALQVMGLPVQ